MIICVTPRRVRHAPLRVKEGLSLKKRFSFICIYLCLLTLFCIGAAELTIVDKNERLSESENRMLQAFPALSAKSVADGSFMSGFESFLSDAFFFRDEAAAFHDGVMGVFTLPDDGPDTGVVEDDRLRDNSAEQAEEFEALTAGDGETAQGGETPAAEGDAQGVSDARVWLLTADGEEETIFTFPAETLVSFAGILDRYRAELPEDGRLYFINPQVAAVANNVIMKPNYVGWGTDLDEGMQPIVGEGVYVLDNMEMLAPYFDTVNLYPIEDYHWHSVSASITADAMMRLQGVPCADYDQYRYWIGFKNDRVAYTTEMLKGMYSNRDTIFIMQAISPAESYFLSNITERQRTTFTMPDGGYVGFLGGHKGPWRLIEGGFHTGRRALVVGDCFTTPLIPYLAPYYDQIISTDVRDNFYSVFLAGANIAEYIQAYDIDDIYVVWSTNARFYSDNIQSRMSKYLDMVY